jgi:glycosyltransferase involved in cell wall biosynthesis
MRLLYIVNQRIPTEKAYGIQIAKSCEAFVRQGIGVELLAPKRKGSIDDSFFNYYGIDKNFTFERINSPDFYWPGLLDKLAFLFKQIISAIKLSRYALKDKPDFIYSRDELPLFILSFFRNSLCYEAHRFSERRGFFYRRFKKCGMKIVVISGGLKDKFIKFGFSSDKMLVAHDGVNLQEFNISKGQKECRDMLGLPVNKKIIGFVGQLKTMGMDKGVGTLIKAYKQLYQKHPDLMVVIVGGKGEDLIEYKNLTYGDGLSENQILFAGQQDHKIIPAYLRSFDILAMPYPYNTHYAFYMSPLKLFEYMASKRPIITSDLPSVREVLNNSNAIFVEPGDPGSLSEGILKIINNEEFSVKITEQAFSDIKEYTWDKRVEKILNFLT